MKLRNSKSILFHAFGTLTIELDLTVYLESKKNLDISYRKCKW